MTEYIRSPRFKAFGAGLAQDDTEPFWVDAENLDDVFSMYDWSNIALVGQNVKFDGAILAWRYGKTPTRYIDTKGMSRATLGKSIKNHSLGTLAEHFKLPSKGQLKTDGKAILTAEELKELAEYCLHDVWLCRELRSRLAKDFPEGQYEVMHHTIRMFVEPRLKLNVPLLEKSAADEAIRRANIFKEIGIDKAEFASNVKFPKLLESKGYEVPMKESTRKKDDFGNPVMIPALALGDPDFLEMLEGGNEELKTLCEARVAAKSTLLETRSTKLAKIGSTGVWPFDVEFSGADQTHRFSGGSGAGGNPQNFTRGSTLRTAVEAPEGYDLVVGDFDKVECRLVAYLANDYMLIQDLKDDPYSQFATGFYGYAVSKENPKTKDERMFGKTEILGLGYNMGWEKNIKSVRVKTGRTISEDLSRKSVAFYRSRYEYVPRLWATLNDIIHRLVDRTDFRLPNIPVLFTHEGFILPSGLKIQFPNLRQEPGERGDEWVYDVYRKGRLERAKLYGGKLLENISQGLAGELCKEAMIRIGDAVVGQVHDELHVLCKRGLGAITAAKVRRIMSLSPSWMPNIVLDAEVKVGNNWSAAK